MIELTKREPLRTKIAGITFREKEYQGRGQSFPWHLIRAGDACEIREDPCGKTTGNAHNDENALAVIHKKSGVWLGFLPNNDRTQRAADYVHGCLAEGLCIHSCTISAITGGPENGKANRGINLEVEFQ